MCCCRLMRCVIFAGRLERWCVYHVEQGILENNMLFLSGVTRVVIFDQVFYTMWNFSQSFWFYLERLYLKFQLIWVIHFRVQCDDIYSIIFVVN